VKTERELLEYDWESRDVRNHVITLACVVVVCVCVREHYTYAYYIIGGCNGLSYTLNYAFEKPPKDEEMEAHGIKVFIEPMALFNVVGTTMDWEETELSSEFTFSNPNSKGECGCGESFNV
jgi:iron-sulfur cluster assembly protein